MTGDRYDARAAREMWQGLLWRADQGRRIPTVEAEQLARFAVAVVDPMVERVLLDAVATAYGAGWQPVELVHAVTRKAGRSAASDRAPPRRAEARPSIPASERR